MSITRVEAWLSEPIPPKPDFRRCHCKCGCGRWWYWPRTKPGRTPVYATPECYAREKARKRRKGPAVLVCADCGAVFTRAGAGRPRARCYSCQPLKG